MLPQPPSNAPAPPPSDAARRSRRGLWIILSVTILCAAGILVMPLFVKSAKNGPFMQALGNAKSIGLYLQHFEKEYGTFPSAATADDVRLRTGTTLAMGTTSSNGYFRQLLGSDLLNGSGVERIFHAQGKDRRLPDDNWVGTRALERGECGFAYIPGLHSGSPLDFPVVIGPLIRGTDKIDPKPGKGRGAVCLVDGTATDASVDRDGHVMVRGKRLLDPTNPIWGGKPPTLVWPE